MKNKKMWITLSLVLVLLGGFGIFKTKTLADVFGLTTAKAQVTPPTVTGYVGGDSEDSLYIYVSWDMKADTEYGYRIEKEGAVTKLKETAAIFDPAEFGVDDRTSGGFYLDPAVIPNDTYNYYIYAFDRAGNESAPAKVTVKATICGNEYRFNGKEMELQWVCPETTCTSCKK